MSWLGKHPLTRDSYSVAIAAGTTLGACGLSWYLWKKYFHKLPPGPIGFPFIGANHLITPENMDYDLANLGKKYGDIFSIRLGNRLSIILLSHAAIREAFIENAELFAHRNLDIQHYLPVHDDIIGSPYNEEWNSNKAFIMGCARGAGFGTSKGAEEKILDQANYLIAQMELLSMDGKPVNVKELAPKATSNVIYQILFNKSFEYDDPQLLNFIQVNREWSGSFGDATYLTTVPYIIASTYHRKLKQSTIRKTEEMKDIIRKEVKEHIETVDPENPRDFVDLYWIKKGKEHGTERLVSNAFALLPDGVDTTSLALDWIVLFLSTHPEIQQRMVSEINKVTAGNRQVIWSDHNQMPYVEAVIREVLRIRPPLTMSMSHTVPRDVILKGYRIPAGADVYAHMYTAMREPKLFPDPDIFKPERFLDGQGKIIKADSWMPFSLGRRRCAGQQLVEIMLFLLTANLFQRFEFQIPTSIDVSLNPQIGGLIRQTMEYQVNLSSRK